jgi:phosphoglycolate phosphatase
MSNRLAIFDCDGTLVDSQANVCLAMENCFVEKGLPRPNREQSRQVVGLNLLEAMQAMLPDGRHEQHVELAEGYKRHFHRLRAAGLVAEPLYDGIVQLIDALGEGDWLLGVATGKSDRGLALCLEHHGLLRRFVTLQTADRHPSKPNPSMIEQAMADAGASPATTLMIGDTSYDMAMAKAAGVTAIGVAWGYHQATELEAAGADYIANTPADIADFVKALA